MSAIVFDDSNADIRALRHELREQISQAANGRQGNEADCYVAELASARRQRQRRCVVQIGDDTARGGDEGAAGVRQTCTRCVAFKE